MLSYLFIILYLLNVVLGSTITISEYVHLNNYSTDQNSIGDGAINEKYGKYITTPSYNRNYGIYVYNLADNEIVKILSPVNGLYYPGSNFGRIIKSNEEIFIVTAEKSGVELYIYSWETLELINILRPDLETIRNDIGDTAGFPTSLNNLYRYGTNNYGAYGNAMALNENHRLIACHYFYTLDESTQKFNVKNQKCDIYDNAHLSEPTLVKSFIVDSSEQHKEVLLSEYFENYPPNSYINTSFMKSTC